MPVTTEVTSGTVNGLPVVLQTTTDTEVDDTLSFSTTVSTAEITQDVNIAVAVDISGSAGNDSGVDIDGDGNNETVLEVQVAAAKDMFQSLLDAGYAADEVEITLVAYNGTATSLGTFTMDDQAAYDAALDGLSTGGQTNFGAALNQILSVWDATTGDADPDNDVDIGDNNYVIFMSDGFANGSTNFTSQMAALNNTYGAQVSAIGVGAGSDLATLNTIDNTDGAVQITDLSQLSGAIIDPPPPLAELTQVEVFIDGVSYGVYTPGDGVLQSTPLGFTITNEVLSGYAYVPGSTLDFDVVATFDNGETLTTTHSDVSMPYLVCFAAGTMIATPHGPRPVETLAPGDRISRVDGGEAVLRHLATRTLSRRMLRANPDLRPYRINAGAFGPDCPRRDLRVSKQHRILVDGWFTRAMFDCDDGVLAPVHALENGRTVRRDPPTGAITYVHLVFDRHEIIEAEGLAAESLHPCAKTVGRLPDAARQPIFGLFPGLAAAIAAGDDNAEAVPPARRLLRAREARLLVPFLGGRPRPWQRRRAAAGPDRRAT